MVEGRKTWNWGSSAERIMNHKEEAESCSWKGCGHFQKSKPQSSDTSFNKVSPPNLSQTVTQIGTIQIYEPMGFILNQTIMRDHLYKHL